MASINRLDKKVWNNKGFHMSKENKVIVERGSYNGHPTISIWNADPCGNKVGKTPIVSFGLNKAKEIWDNREEIKKFLSQNGYRVD
jgi:hypothetical protein